ncbi:hypothetical protein NDU88_007461 [Pleurodeles waltl]|uniref:Plakophilin 4 n=1 Tax=Pleurodeles waltl TaxID=8319 RepID=A0AAV7LVI4_PLEWA|nr:hypothetical protein NDU88_007461 [Pleurodeles waltl]
MEHIQPKMLQAAALTTRVRNTYSLQPKGLQRAALPEYGTPTASRATESSSDYRSTEHPTASRATESSSDYRSTEHLQPEGLQRAALTTGERNTYSLKGYREQL